MKHLLSLVTVGTLLAVGSVIHSASAQEKYKPKYQRENDTTFRANASYLSETGFIKFRSDKDVDPDTYFDKFGANIGLGTNYQMRLFSDVTDANKIRHLRCAPETGPLC